MKLDIFVGLEIMYTVTLFFEFFSTYSAMKANNKLANKQEKIPLENVVFNQMKIGYFWSWVIGLLMIYIGYELVIFIPVNVYLQLVILAVILLPLFIIRNFIYAAISNYYIDKQIAKFKASTELSKNFNPNRKDF